MTRPSGARWSSPSRRSAIQARSVASKSALEPVGGGLVGPEDAEVGLAGVGAHDVAQPAAEHARGLAARRPRGVDRRPRSRGSRAATGRAAAAPPLACGLAPMRRSPSGASAVISAATPAVLVEQLLGAVASASTPRAPRGARGSRPASPAAPGGRGRCPRSAGRRPPWGPVQPLGVRRTIIGQRGRSVAAARARAPGWRRCRSTTWSSVAAMSWCIGRRVVALDEVRLVAVADAAARAARRAGCAPARSGWRSCSR